MYLMQQVEKDKLLFSPSDLITFLGCHHATYLDLKWLSGEIKPAEDSTSNKLLQDKGYEHEKNYLQSLKDNAKVIFEISKDQPSEVRTRQTTDALQSGSEIIYQARLTDYPWYGDADFLIKTDTPSKLGAFSYEVLDTKLSRSPEPKHIMQLCV